MKMQPNQAEAKNNLPILAQEYFFWDKGFDYIIGVDEVGRGCIAGPIVTAGVVWKRDQLEAIFHDQKSLAYKIRDSKKISKNVRYKLSHWIIQNCLCHSKTEIDSSIIDKKGIQYSNKEAMVQSIIKCKEQLPVNSNIIAFTDYVDISKELAEYNVKCVPILHGDNSSFTIASASIVAKVHRDAYMTVVAHNEYPEYGFDTHVGYGTAKHFEIIKNNGISPLHRRTFIQDR